jgi:glycosyltransferase involved in cell wall biosynthesis
MNVRLSVDKQKNILLIQWGRHGAGPLILYEIAKSLQGDQRVKAFISFSRYADMYHELISLGLPSMKVRTYRNRFESVFSFLTLPLKALLIRRFIEERSIRLIISPMCHIHEPYIISYLKRSTGVRYICAIHDAVSHPGDHISAPWHDSTIRNTANADAVLVFSEYTRRRMNEVIGTGVDMLTVPLGPMHTDWDAPKNRKWSDKMTLLFAGRVMDYKGISILLKAWPKISKRLPGATLMICGGGDWRSMEHELPIDGKVVLEREYVPEGRLRDLMLRADMVLAPYTEASQSGIIAIAQTHGIPVVCTSVGGLTEQVQDGVTGVVSVSVDGDAFAEAVIRLAVDESLYVRCSSSSVRVMQAERSWDLGMSKVIDHAERERWFECVSN